MLKGRDSWCWAAGEAGGSGDEKEELVWGGDVPCLERSGVEAS